MKRGPTSPESPSVDPTPPYIGVFRGYIRYEKGGTGLHLSDSTHLTPLEEVNTTLVSRDPCESLELHYFFGSMFHEPHIKSVIQCYGVFSWLKAMLGQ